jgi:AraC family transcriptional regulator
MAIATVLYEGPDLLFAELDCPPDDPAWGEENLVTRPIVALPVTPVWQVHDGRERQLFNQNHVVHHGPGHEYHRERFGDLGYRCLFMMPSASLFRQVVAEVDPAAGDADEVGLPDRSGPLDVRTFVLSRLAARHLRLCLCANERRSGPEGDDRAAREALYEVLHGAVRSASPARPGPSPARPSTLRARRELVEATKEALTRRMAEGASLDHVARTLHTSPYHLARLFRSATGFSVHRYLTHLRLRTGLDRLQDGHSSDGIGRVGLDVGYRTPSHFTASFRRTFGLAPSRLAADALPAARAD